MLSLFMAAAVLAQSPQGPVAPPPPGSVGGSYSYSQQSESYSYTAPGPVTSPVVSPCGVAVPAPARVRYKEKRVFKIRGARKGHGSRSCGGC